MVYLKIEHGIRLEGLRKITNPLGQYNSLVGIPTGYPRIQVYSLTATPKSGLSLRKPWNLPDDWKNAGNVLH